MLSTKKIFYFHLSTLVARLVIEFYFIYLGGQLLHFEVSTLRLPASALSFEFQNKTINKRPTKLTVHLERQQQQQQQQHICILNRLFFPQNDFKKDNFSLSSYFNGYSPSIFRCGATLNKRRMQLSCAANFARADDSQLDYKSVECFVPRQKVRSCGRFPLLALTSSSSPPRSTQRTFEPRASSRTFKTSKLTARVYLYRKRATLSG